MSIRTRRWTAVLVVGAAALACASGAADGRSAPASERTVGAQALFDEAWGVFDKEYSYFQHKRVDWAAVRARHRGRFAEVLTPVEFARRLADVTSVLHDWHVAVTAPDGQVFGYRETLPRNFPATPRNRYVVGGYRTLGSGVVQHGWLLDRVAYLRVDTLLNERWRGVPDSDVEHLFARYRTAAGMIIDLRANAGGNERYAALIAGHLTRKPVVFGHYRLRQGPRHADLGPAQAKTLQPSRTNAYDGPVVALIGRAVMSSAEWFTLMLKACPKVTLMGDRTRGASGNPRSHRLANGVSFTLSRWVALTADRKPFEDRGIAPDVAIDPARSVDGEQDRVVLAALELLRRKR